MLRYKTEGLTNRKRKDYVYGKGEDSRIIWYVKIRQTKK